VGGDIKISLAAVNVPHDLDDETRALLEDIAKWGLGWPEATFRYETGLFIGLAFRQGNVYFIPCEPGRLKVLLRLEEIYERDYYAYIGTLMKEQRWT